MPHCPSNQCLFFRSVNLPLSIDFPASLPVSARRHEIEQAMRSHQVVIVCGETGSGKTTQLPKIALAMGRAAAAPGQPPRLIGHTQPRRIAASSVAKRIASELQTPLGQVVGYKVRFQDRLEPGARVKLMTDGILLAETQRDPLLRMYDTLIIDEAHERSLNIDFLLGYLRQLLPKRPDLKLVITSATIDADRFAAHFSSAQGPAPVIMVSGRTYPVEQRYRPFEESREYGLNQAVADAVDELWQGPGAGDILIFLPGEREIRDLADHLRGHLSHRAIGRAAEILPLFSRLSQADQERVFEPSSDRRIVLATNVAETSLTVPGIRFVIDVGTARVKRYSLRSKVEQLQVEPVSQAAANQRAGRCGRVADGICIRLYDEADFAKRPKFTEPEILRSSLAGVILRMKALGLGQIDAFPFIDPPSSRAINDGLQLLSELGALDEHLQLTPLGLELARWPLDPRIARMIIEARTRGALDEVLVIASALSVQDVRDRPIEAQAQADQQHAKFKDDRSEFSGYLTLWRWLQDARGGHGQSHKLSNRQHEQLLKSNFIHVRRVREWRDVHSQLLTVVTEQGFKLNATPASYEQIHVSMLSGLLGNIGCKVDDEEVYQGARGIKFHRHPGAHLRKKPGRWLVAAELVDTSRLFGRGLAAIDPTWLEQVGAHLLKKQWLDPRFDPKSGEVLAFERATLYGLVVYSGRKRPYAAVDPAGAREIFIREALVAPGWDAKLPFLNANRKLVRAVQELEHKSRRQDVLVDDELIFAYYDAHIPASVCNGHDLQAWWRQACPSQPQLLHMGREDLMRHEAASITAQAFPRVIRLGGVDCATEYWHQPGDARDGLTVTVPLFVLNQVTEERAEWLVPGMLKDKLQALLKSLPQKPRSRFVPLPESAQRLAQELSEDSVFGHGSLIDVLLTKVRQSTSLDVKRADFKLDMVPPHLFMNFRIVDEHGRQLGIGRNLGALRSEWGHQARGAFQALAQLKAQGLAGQSMPAAASPAASGQAMHAAKAAPSKVASAEPPGAGAATGPFTEWVFGELPELMEIRKGGQTLIGFPALVDLGSAVQIEVFDEPDVAQKKHQVGLRRLFALHIKDALKYLEKNIPDLQKMAVAYMALGTSDELRGQIIDLALDRAFLQEPWPTDAASFKSRLDEGRSRLTLIANEVARMCAQVLSEYAAAAKKIRDSKSSPQASADCAQQLQRLVGKTFVRDTPWTQMQHLVRYLKAIAMRLDKCRADPARDEQRMSEVKAQEQRYWRLVADRKGATDARMLEFRWLLEELRVSLFAQELRTPQPVSTKRLDKAWSQLN
jgi:ATP-dependent helicase HrpA